MEKYEWYPTVCAPKGYPVQVHEGAFRSGNEWIGIPAGGIVSQGWGVSGNIMIIGPNLKLAPEYLIITWLSFAENKFYSGEFKLNTETIAALFKEGGSNAYSGEYETYTEIIVGLAPGGIVVVWLTGMGRNVEVGRYEAEQTEIKWKEFSSAGIQDRNQYIRLSITGEDYAQIQKKGIPFGVWDKYRNRFNIKPIIRYDQHVEVLTESVYLEFYNGERDYLYGWRLKNLNYSYWARISFISINFIFSSQQYNAQLTFEESKLFESYKATWSGQVEKPVELIIIINRGNDEIQAFFKNKEQKINLYILEKEIN